jgi:hypothetical protein
VQRELASLSEGLSAAIIWASEWFLACMNVHVLFEVLTECEGLPASQTGVLLGWNVCGLVAPEREPGGEGFIAAGVCLASVGLLHCFSMFF